ncbi:type I DNA topoisomerase [Nesterenkonia alba]|uniref:type I DNA topoisomerase n=1 Tax=Nesterenkonia alba TaxID=515814 RepID=UPI0003B421CA|nr:type I DNA topoisomerase [Nesterenkonia alba]
MSGKKLVIVESPAKSRSIGKYLGEDFIVDASAGHIRDLPQPSELPDDMKKGPFGKFAVDPEHGFEPYYVVSDSKKSKVRELKQRLKEADELYLATDADREGEAIAWHLYEVLKPKVPTYRLTFTEITKEGIQRALQSPREIDNHLVDAQETRRILDRLFGYEISPVLWRKVGRGLSAGRVQSVATRMVVDRERERMAFIPASYWDLSGTFSTDGGESFTAKLHTVDGERIASGGDFDDRGELKKNRRDVVVLTEADATSLAEGLTKARFTVDSVEDKPYSRRPQPPFITSTLQQDAARRLRFSSRVTMQVAQRLYENGYITYMRTDSTTLSNEALNAARKQASELYGSESVPEKPRVYGKRSQTAQEAHEAIRPAGDSFRTPKQVKGELSADEYKLYELIWKRTVASQMEDAKGYTASVRLSGEASDGRRATFGASGTVITFPGFLAAYEEARDTTEASSSDDAKDRRLPELTEGENLTGEDIEAKGHETTPPPRYTEASIVAELEKREIGRPSTYAPTISTIMDRGYVTKRGSALVPSWTAFSVVRLLEEHFGRYVDYDFTARLEDDLDQIARGEIEREAWLQHFYFGAESGEEGLKAVVDNLGEIDARAINSMEIAPGVELRVGRYGPYLERANPNGEVGEDGELKRDRANIPEDIAPDELTAEKAEELFEQAAHSGRVLGTDPQTGRQIVAKDGRYGPYVTEVIEEMTAEEIQAAMDAQPTEYYKNGKPKPKKKPKQPKPRTASLLKSMSLETVTLEDALKLLSLPRVVGTDDDGQEITAQNGRFGPYLKKGSDSRSLQDEEQLFTISLDEAKKIFAQPKQRGRQAAQPPLAEFGADPTTEKPVVVKDGRFGPYITDGETNVTVPRGTSVENLTKEQAFSLLAEKRAKGPASKGKGGRRKTTAKA